MRIQKGKNEVSAKRENAGTREKTATTGRSGKKM